jgi:hypothetical protein
MQQRVDSGQKFLPGETGWTKDFRLLSWVVLVPNPSGGPGSSVMELLMATLPSVPALAWALPDLAAGKRQ